MFGSKPSHSRTTHTNQLKEKLTWDVPIFFTIMFLLAIAEMFFTIDSLQYLQKTRTFHSKTERARLAFLAFSSARTILLSAVYMGFHCARRFFGSMLHTVFLVISTILWIVSGVLIHQMWGVIICNQGVGHIRGGLTECHELKIIEIIAWVLAGVSVIATVPVVMNAMKRRKMKHERKTEVSG
ncbi:hypothetical protein B0J14DRAFT_590740 [Halenospora varia]|nr:hypothetical protein B0J14DRAFT_590740 [Halenospora varia]